MKSIKALAGGLALAAIVGANGYMAASGRVSESELSLDGLEALANPESNPWYSWIPYGFTADECEKYFKCSVSDGGGLYIGFIPAILGCTISNGNSYPGHERCCYDGGYINCSSESCKKDSDWYREGVTYFGD